MEWDKNNIDEIVGFINRELETGRPMNNIELEEFGVNERVIHKRLLRIGYKKIDNQYYMEDSITSNITNNTKKINKVNKQSNIICNSDLDMDKLNLLLANIDKILKLIPTDTTSNITHLKSGSNEVRSLRIDTGLYEVIKDRASRDKVNISAIVNKALEDYINNNKPSIMLVGGTTLGRSLAPRLAARFRTGLTADCTILDIQENTDLDQIRPAFGGNIMAHINTPNSRPQFATVRYKIFNIPEKVEEPTGKITLCSVEKEKLTSNIKVLETKIKNKVVGIEEAEVIVVASRAFKKEEDLKMLNELADVLGAQIAGTRPTIECGWVDPKKQIGLSGRTVKPKLIITCGVSGAVQFVAGMKGSDYIIAINQDEKAPIFDVAHLGIIGDIYEIIPKLTEKIKAMKNENKQKVAQMAE